MPRLFTPRRAVSGLAVCIIFGLACAGCADLCLSEVGFICGATTDPVNGLSVFRIVRPDGTSMLMFANKPEGQSNGRAVLVGHYTSDSTIVGARQAALQWGSFLTSEGYTVVAHAYREEDSGYGEKDLEDTLLAIDWLNGPGASLLGVHAVYFAGTSRGGILAHQVAFHVGADQVAGVVADRGVSDFVTLEQESELFQADGLGDAIEKAIENTIKWLGGLPEDNPQPWIDISSAYHADKIVVPMLVLQGTDDVLIPVQQAIEFRDIVQRLGKTNIQVRLYSGYGHYSLGFVPFFRQTIVEFLNSH